jgi:hypothetical protein
MGYVGPLIQRVGIQTLVIGAASVLWPGRRLRTTFYYVMASLTIASAVAVV